MRSVGAAHKNNEAPRSFDSASRGCHLERSREISLAERPAHHLRYFDHRLIQIQNPIPNPWPLIPAFKLGFRISPLGGFAAYIYFAAKLPPKP